MKFDEMVSEKTSITIKSRIVISILSIALVLTLGYIVCDKILFNQKNKEREQEVSLNTDSRIVKTLYNRIHDFQSSNPFWLYQNENNNLISSMTEGAKMSLVYLNLKETDFISSDCVNMPVTISGYPEHKCTSGKFQIKRENIERVYKELFGTNTSVNTSVMIKTNQEVTGLYLYVSSLDSYILYSIPSVAENTTLKYQYQVTKASKTSTGDIQLYEVVAIQDTSSNTKKEEEYRYTFRLDNDGMYTYYSRDKTK